MTKDRFMEERQTFAGDYALAAVMEMFEQGILCSQEIYHFGIRNTWHKGSGPWQQVVRSSPM